MKSATLGVTATSATAVVSVNSTSTNVTSYSDSLSGSATETLTLSNNTNLNAIAAVAGTKTTGDVLTLTTFDAGLSGGHEAVSYTVVSADTLSTIATGLTAAINADTHLQGIGVSATSSGTIITVQSNSINSTSYRQTFSSTATENLAITTPTFGWQEATIGGTKSTGNVLTLSVFDSGLSSGQASVTYTVLSTDTLTSIATGLAAAVNANSSLSGIGVTASSSGAVVSIESTSPNLTTYTQSVSSGGTETITLGPTTGVMQASFNDVNELTSLSPGGATRFQGTTDKPAASVTLNSQIVNIQSTPSLGLGDGNVFKWLASPIQLRSLWSR